MAVGTETLDLVSTEVDPALVAAVEAALAAVDGALESGAIALPEGIIDADQRMKKFSAGSDSSHAFGN